MSVVDELRVFAAMEGGDLEVIDRAADVMEELLEVVKQLNAAAITSSSALEFSQMCDTFIEEARAALSKATGSAS